MREIGIHDFLTKKQVAAAQRLYNKSTPGKFAKECADKIIAPEIERINRRLGQKNDPLFLAYLCEYVFGEAKRG